MVVVLFRWRGDVGGFQRVLANIRRVRRRGLSEDVLHRLADVGGGFDDGGAGGF